MARFEKVAEAIKKEVSNIIQHELKDPRRGFVTITQVELTPDMRSAKIFYSVLGKEEDYARTKNALESATGFIRSLIAQRLELRFAPEIVFKEDRSQEYSVRIQEILEEIKGIDQPKIISSEEEKAENKRQDQVFSVKKKSKRVIRKEKRCGPKKSNRVNKKK
ncbi:MAG: 30S ribosome-binding factor RbfA [Candidatus Omnitrophota bacterium]